MPRSAAADTHAVRVTHLRKTYGTKVAVDDVSFDVAHGEIFGILGPNGAGKTTTVECLAGLRAADGGTIRVLGHDPQDPNEAVLVRERLGIQLQESQLPVKLRVHEALTLYASFYADPDDPSGSCGSSASRTAATPRSRTCRAVRSSGCRSRSPSSASPRSRSSTSSRPASTRRRGARRGT